MTNVVFDKCMFNIWFINCWFLVLYRWVVDYRYRKKIRTSEIWGYHLVLSYLWIWSKILVFSICICLMSHVSMLLTLKLDQLIWAAARGRRNDDMIRLWVHTRYSQFPSVGSFTCLSIEHWVQGTLWLYVTCDWQACWDFADEGHLKMLGSPPWDRTQAPSAAGEWLNH